MKIPGEPINPDDLCAVHGYEPIRPGAWGICPECWHCFLTEDELVMRDQMVRLKLGWPGERGDPRPASEITICPVCSHDF